MVFPSNNNLGRTISDAIKFSKGGLLTGTILFFFILVVVIAKTSGSILLLYTTIDFVLWFIIYIIGFIRRILPLHKIISKLEIDGEVVNLESTGITIFRTVFEIAKSRVQFLKSDLKIHQIENNVLFINYEADLFCIILNGKKYYLFENFFDDFEQIRKILLLQN